MCSFLIVLHIWGQLLEAEHLYYYSQKLLSSAYTGDLDVLTIIPVPLLFTIGTLFGFHQSYKDANGTLFA